jgi:cysteine synthase A
MSHAYNGLGTGGTIAGVGRYIKSIDESVVVALADPEGSGLYNKESDSRAVFVTRPTNSCVLLNSQVKYGVMYDQKESEGTKRRHQVDTVVEGM